MPSPRERTRAAVYAAHLSVVRCSWWRLGVVDGWWQIARCGPGPDGWVVLDERLRGFGDIDPAVERRRVVSWCSEVLGVRSLWLWRDHAAQAQGRVAFAVQVVG